MNGTEKKTGADIVAGIIAEVLEKILKADLEERNDRPEEET